MEILTSEDLRMIDPIEFADEVISEREILKWFEACDAVWIHDGRGGSPHAELTSGKCSNGYFNCSNVLKYPNLTEILAQQLYLEIGVRLRKTDLLDKIDYVIGSPYAGITYSYELAKAFGAVHGFTEKDPQSGNKKAMKWKRDSIPEGATVLQVEELVTTSGTFQEVRKAVRRDNKNDVNFLPFVATLIHRPVKLPTLYPIEDNGEKTEIEIISLINKEIWAVDQEDCPLCKKGGSERLRPKENWFKLTNKIPGLF